MKDRLKKDKFYKNMHNLIQIELKDRNISNNISSEAIDYLANCNLLIVDVYKVLDILSKENERLIEIKDIKEILKSNNLM